VSRDRRGRSRSASRAPATAPWAPHTAQAELAVSRGVSFVPSDQVRVTAVETGVDPAVVEALVAELAI
jgi:hypothetical protein